MLKKPSQLLFLTLCLLSTYFIDAQVMVKETPVSIALGRSSNEVTENNKVVLSAPDVEKALREDKDEDNYRFALPVECKIDPYTFGSWETLPNGDKLWKISIESSGSKGWILWFDDYKLPKGSKLFIYNESGRFVKGAYSDYNNKTNKKLTVGPVGGSKIIVEYFEPKDVKEKGSFKISKAFYIYKASENIPGTMSSLLGDPAYLGSLPCMVNINCPEGDPYQKQKNSVVRMLLSGDAGYFYCTGSLMNNTKKDSTPYILSGFHCEHAYTTPSYDNFIFYFNWEVPGCVTPVQEPVYSSIDGCVRMAGREESDFMLYKLQDKIPKTVSVYFNGWNKNDTKLPGNPVMIHHPQGDVKKISIAQSAAVIWNSPINWNNGVITPAKNHWRITLKKGASQGGSSGAPLYDEAGRVVGQLNGGSSNCNFSSLFYGRFSKSWADGSTPETRLKEWLDPLNIGADTLSGLEVIAPTFVNIGGKVTNSKGIPIKNVTVKLTGGATRTTTTNDLGEYFFDLVDQGLNYTITPTFDTYPLDGVSVADMSFMNRHILGVKFIESEFKKLAADVNESDNITTVDMSILNKMILGKEFTFPSKKNWIMVTPNYKFQTGSTYKDKIQITNLQYDSLYNNFYAIKFGDVSGTN